MDRINNRPGGIRSQYNSAADAPPDYRMPLFEDQTAYSAGRPGNSSNTYFQIKAGLEDRGIDVATWNQMPTDQQWDTIGEILTATPDEAEPSPMPFSGRGAGPRFDINPRRRGL